MYAEKTLVFTMRLADFTLINALDMEVNMMEIG